MKTAYIDSSCIIAVLFQEPRHRQLLRQLQSYDELFSSNLLEAEIRAAVTREQVAHGPDGVLSWISWVLPDRPLTSEFKEVLALGYLKGADLWHLATALFLQRAIGGLEFRSLDRRQLAVAQKLGMQDSGKTTG